MGVPYMVNPHANAEANCGGHLPGITCQQYPEKKMVEDDVESVGNRRAALLEAGEMIHDPRVDGLPAYCFVRQVRCHGHGLCDRAC